jgi:hypothetical protein
MWKGQMTATTKSKRGSNRRIFANATDAELFADDIAPWSQQRIACRRKQKDTWILCEVGTPACPAKDDSKNFTAMTASQMRIAETIDAFYGDAGTKDGVSRSYKQAVEDLDAETIKALDGPYR